MSTVGCGHCCTWAGKLELAGVDICESKSKEEWGRVELHIAGWGSPELSE